MIKKKNKSLTYIDQSPPRFIFQQAKVYMPGSDALNATDEEIDEFMTLMDVASLACQIYPGINLNNCRIIRLSH